MESLTNYEIDILMEAVDTWVKSKEPNMSEILLLGMMAQAKPEEL